MSSIQLYGRIFLRFNIELLSGLHIGGAASSLEIGGLDKPVIRNALTNQPYIPGSSLKGKMRSLTEKAHAAPQNQQINKNVFVHRAETLSEYYRYPVSRIFGMLPDFAQTKDRIPAPTRLTVRDVPLLPDSAEKLSRLRTDLPYTEVKWEAAIDRVTSAASPRQIERVPAGAVFGPAELVYSVYVGDGEDARTVAGWFTHVIEALDYLEDDYLGGMGSRGSGRVRCTNLAVETRRMSDAGYGEAVPVSAVGDSIRDIDRASLVAELQQRFG